MKVGMVMQLDQLLKIRNFENPIWQTDAILKIEKSRYLQNCLADIDKILQDENAY